MNNSDVLLHSISSIALCLILFPAESDRFTLCESTKFKPPTSCPSKILHYPFRIFIFDPNMKSPAISRPSMGQLNEVLIDYFNKFKMGNDCRGGDSGRQPYMHTLLASWLHATSQLLCCLRLSQAALAQAAPRQVQQQSLDERERERESIAQMRV